MASSSGSLREDRDDTARRVELGGRTRTEAPEAGISWLTVVALLAATASTAGTDRVTFPTAYRSHALYFTVDRAVNDTVRVFYVSPEAARRAKPGEPLPSGTVITMEIYKAKLDAAASQ